MSEEVSIRRMNMKKGIVLVVILLTIILSSFTVNAEAQLTIQLDGNQVQYNDEYGQPFIDENGRTQVPLRKTMEDFGCDVQWDNDNYQALLTMNDMEVIIPVGKNHIIIDGYIKQIDTVSLIKEGRIYLPIRPVVEAFEGNVEWDSLTQKVKINRVDNNAYLIDEVEINNNGELVITTNAGNVINLGRVTGKDGDDGRNGKSGSDGISVKSVRLDAGNNLIVTLSNGQTINAGNVSGVSEYKTFARYDEGTKFYNLYPQGEFNIYVMKGREKHTVTITDAYYELVSINDINDESSWDFVEHNDGWYEFRPFDVNVVIEGYTDTVLAGDEISFDYTGFGGHKGIVQNDGTIRVVGADSWIYPQLEYFHRATLYSQPTDDLSDLQEDLNYDYNDIKGVTIGGITLTGGKDDIEVAIHIDTTNITQYDAWTDLRDSDITNFLYDIVDDIRVDYPNADIAGFIIDNHDDSILIDFIVSGRGTIDFERTGISPGDIQDLEDVLLDTYYEIEGMDIDGIFLLGDENDVEIKIHIDLTQISDFNHWVDNVSDSEVEDFLQDIVDEIIAYYPNVNITGVIIDYYDDAVIVEFLIDSSGNVIFDRDL
jgi:hypothetical protein